MTSFLKLFPSRRVQAGKSVLLLVDDTIMRGTPLNDYLWQGRSRVDFTYIQIE